MAEQWTHERLRDYLKSEEGRGRSEGRGAWGVEREAKGEERGAKSEEGRAWSVERGAVWLLVDLVDQIKNGVEIPDNEKEREIPRSFDETEEMLSVLMSGAGSAEMKRRFLGALYHSADFYQRVLVKMEQMVPAINEDIPAEMAQVAIKMDDQILGEMGIAKQGQLEIKTKKSINGKFQEIAERLFGWLVPSPRYAYVLAVLIFGLIIVIPGSVLYYVSVEDETEDIFAEYVYNNKVPYEYRESGLRGESDVLVDEPLVQNFIYQFKMGMSDYVICNYEEAINRWEILELDAEKLLRYANRLNFINMVREYYFYLGVAQIAMGRDQKLRKEVQQDHLIKSIRFLNRSVYITQDSNNNEIDRENFFLGLAHVFSGNKLIGLNKLLKINPENEFYQEAVNLIKKSSNN